MIETKPYVRLIAILSAGIFLFSSYRFVQFITLTALFTILLCYLYVRHVSKRLVIERFMDVVRLANHEQLDISFKVKNYSRFPVLSCYVMDETSTLVVYNKGNNIICTLRPHEVKSFSYRILGQERGEFYIGPVRLRFADPLGLFTVVKYAENQGKVIVRPANIPLNIELNPGLPQGTLKIADPCYEDITMPKAVREYQSGDEMKRINWRTSAKFNQLYTNEYQFTYDVPVFVFVNLARGDYPFEKGTYVGERALEIAAALVTKAAEHNLNCGFGAYGTDFPFLKPAKNQTNFILDILSTINMVEGKMEYNPVEKFKAQLPFGTRVFVVGPEQVELYNAKEMAGKKDISTSSIKLGGERK